MLRKLNVAKLSPWCALVLVSAAWGTEAPALASQVTEQLRNRVEAALTEHRVVVAEQVLRPRSDLLQFYADRAFAPAWVGNRGPLPTALELLDVLKHADEEGLRPQDYRVTTIQRSLDELARPRALSDARAPSWLADLDLLLSDAFITYGNHQLRGRVRPETLYLQSRAIANDDHVGEVLKAAVETGNVRGELASLAPSSPAYSRLREALARYRDRAPLDKLRAVPAGPTLRQGDRDSRVEAVRRRLVTSGDLDPAAVAGDDFDAPLEEAVRRFQSRHGLDVDGAVGRMTLAALNVPAEKRVEQIALNMERWRWLPRDFGPRYILVNIPAFSLEVVDHGKRIMGMRVIVGKPYWSTPVFSARMTYLVLNPYWQVPPSIAVREILPLLRKDPEYLTREDMRVFEGWGADRIEIDPDSVDWTRVPVRGFPFRLRQEPGPDNPLGRVKFMFPNRFNVYLHDTPSKRLFAKPVRGFSHGCIRIEKAMDLAQYLLEDDPQWTRQDIEAAANFSKERTVRLPDPISVEIVYLTAWVDDHGIVQFRNDIYGRDKALAKALNGAVPTGSG